MKLKGYSVAGRADDPLTAAGDAVSLGLQTEDAADPMEAALAVADPEPLPPGRLLDGKVARVLGVEGIPGTVRMHSSQRAVVFGRGSLEYPPYSRDPAAAADAQALAFEKGMGWAVEVPKGDEFWCYLHKGGTCLIEDSLRGVGIDDAYLAVGVDELDTVGVGITPMHARALAIVGGEG